MSNNKESAFKTLSALSRQAGALKRPVPAGQQRHQGVDGIDGVLASACPVLGSAGLAGLAEAALNVCTTVGCTTPAVQGVDGIDLNLLIAV